MTIGNEISLELSHQSRIGEPNGYKIEYRRAKGEGFSDEDTNKLLLAYRCRGRLRKLRAARRFVPEGRNESSPAIYCWVSVEKERAVPEGPDESSPARSAGK